MKGVAGGNICARSRWVRAGELIIRNKTKAILFPVLQDVNLSWLYSMVFL